MNLTISALSWQGYVDLFGCAYRPNLLQSPLYAKMARLVYGQTSRPYAIEHDGQPIGVVNFQEASIMRGMVHGLICDRGPLWINPKYERNLGAHQAFYTWLADEFPRRFGRRRRIIPECDRNLFRGALRDDLLGKGFRPIRGREAYQTIWMDIAKDEEVLFAALSSKRRNELRKIMRSDITITWESDPKTSPHHAAIILAKHQADRRARQFRAASLKTMSVFIHQAAMTHDLLVGTARLYGEIIGGVIFLIHGQSATYQIGWNAPEAKEMRANRLLLWQGILQLKSHKHQDISAQNQHNMAHDNVAGTVKWLDLGGINDADAAGVKQFKTDFAGPQNPPTTLIGQYG